VALRLFVKIVAPVVGIVRSWQGHFSFCIPNSRVSQKSTKSAKVGHALQTITENTSTVGLVRFKCAFLCGCLPKIGRAQIYVAAQRSGLKTYAIREFAGFDKVALRGCP